MRLTNDQNLPQPLVDAVAADDYSRGAADISVTGLLGPPRIAELVRRYDDELTEDASERIYSLFGKAIHKILEESNRVGIAEQRLFMTVGDWTVSGQMDRMALIDDGSGNHVLSDWKTASVWEIIYGVKPEREQQLNVYKVLAELNGYPVSRLEDVFILRDWSKGEARRSNAPTLRASETGDSRNYPAKQVVVHPINIWPQEEAFRFIAERVALHKAVRDGTIELPECTDEERWARPAGFAVMKTGAKRASRVCATEEEAETYIAEKKLTDAFIERRVGESIRCLDYCPAAAVCEQWAQLQVEPF